MVGAVRVGGVCVEPVVPEREGLPVRVGGINHPLHSAALAAAELPVGRHHSFTRVEGVAALRGGHLRRERSADLEEVTGGRVYDDMQRHPLLLGLVCVAQVSLFDSAATARAVHSSGQWAERVARALATACPGRIQARYLGAAGRDRAAIQLPVEGRAALRTDEVGVVLQRALTSLAGDFVALEQVCHPVALRVSAQPLLHPERVDDVCIVPPRQRAPRLVEREQLTLHLCGHTLVRRIEGREIDRRGLALHDEPGDRVVIHACHFEPEP